MDHAHEHHHELPTSGRALDAVALSATLHCLTGCAIGEVTGMVIGTALGFSDWGTIALAVALAFLFGYSLTSLPLLRAGLALAVVIPIALATDTFSIAVMEVVDNAIMVAVPGAMEAGVGDMLFWGALSVALVIAGFVAFPVNRWLITKGRGHAVLHESGHHPNFPTRAVGAVAAVAFVFGTVVVTAELLDGDSGGHGAEAAEHEAAPEPRGHGGHASDGEPAAVRGLSASESGLALHLDRRELPRGRRGELTFRITGEGGGVVRDFEVEHEKRMHLIVARDDLTGFQHLHPKQADDGSWSVPIEIDEPGEYRVFADFKSGGENRTLAAEVSVPGEAERTKLPPPADTARAGDYSVRLEGGDSAAGRDTELSFEITRGGEPVEVEPYLGAGGHLVALRETDMAYLHVHPTEGGDHGGGHGGEHSGPVAFTTEFPTEGSYRLFLQFRHEGKVHTAEFTREVAG